MGAILSESFPIHGAGISMQGGRQENQDDWGFIDTPLGFLLVVCDGMGGGPGGKTASFIAKREIAVTLKTCTPQTPRLQAIQKAITRAHEAITLAETQKPELAGMGSTVVALIINNQSAVVAHVGDSRCYQIRGKRCIYRTIDHSLVAELVKRKALTEEQARTSPQSNVITRGLGATRNHVPEVEEISFRRGDRFVLCTDGVWGSMPNSQLIKSLTSTGEITALAGNLSMEIDNIGFASGGGHDNHTLIFVEMGFSSIKKEPLLQIIRHNAVSIYSAIGITILAAGICIWMSTNKKTPIQTTSNNCAPISRYQNTLVSTNSKQGKKAEINDSIKEPLKNVFEQQNDSAQDKGPKDSTNQKQSTEQNTTKATTEKATKKPTTVAKKQPTTREQITTLLQEMENMKISGQKEAAQYQENHLNEIKTILSDITKSNEDKKIKQRADNVLGGIKNYKNILMIQVSQEESKFFTPTDNAKNEIKKLHNRINWIYN